MISEKGICREGKCCKKYRITFKHTPATNEKNVLNRERQKKKKKKKKKKKEEEEEEEEEEKEVS